MKDSEIKLYFIKTVFNTYPIVKVEGENNVLNFFKKNVMEKDNIDVLNILYSEEIEYLNLKNIKSGNYILKFNIVIIHYDNSTDFCFTNFELEKDKMI